MQDTDIVLLAAGRDQEKQHMVFPSRPLTGDAKLQHMPFRVKIGHHGIFLFSSMCF